MKCALTQGCSPFILAAVSLVCILIPSVSFGDGNPARIVSLAPNITREIHDLGAAELLVGVTSYSPAGNGPPVEIVGSPARINVEKTFSLRPQLVLASTDCNSRSDIEQLKRLGLTVHVFAGCESFACMCRTFEELGAMLGRSQRAGEVLAGVRAQLSAVQGRIPGKDRPKVFWQLGENPLVTANSATFSGELIRMAGCVNIFGDAPMHYPRVNVEEVVRRNPDVIVVVSQMGSSSASATWDRFTTINAVSRKRVHVISADLVCQPTPVMYLKGYKAVLALLYPGVP